MRVLGLWLACVAVSSPWLLISTSACTDTTSECALARDCDLCVRDGLCAWCFETGQCLVPETHCPGERSLTLDQCEAGQP